MPLIAMTREMRSLGKDVAQCVAALDLEVIEPVRGSAFAETGGSHATLENLSLSARVRAAPRKSNMKIVCDRGRVTLPGIVDGDPGQAMIVRLAGG